MKNQFLRIRDISSEFLLNHDPLEIEGESLLNINLNRVILNLLNSLGDFFTKETKGMGLRKVFLKKFLNKKENRSIFSYCIWMSILEYNFKHVLNSKGFSCEKEIKRTRNKKALNKKTPTKMLKTRLIKLKTELQQKIAVQYIPLMDAQDKQIKIIIEKVYFDVVAQAVFYSLFYAFPKSRINFNYDFRYFLFSLMSKFFVGLVVSPVSRFSKHWTFVDDWYLDLGAGNVLAKKIYNKKSITRPLDMFAYGKLKNFLIIREFKKLRK
jgi:hypothetical protein